MRIDAEKGDFNWRVYDAENCCELKCVVWIDDGTNEYCVLSPYPAILVEGQVSKRTIKARKIDIYTGRKLIVINPVEDGEDAQITRAVSEPVLIES